MLIRSKQMESCSNADMFFLVAIAKLIFTGQGAPVKGIDG